MPQTSQDAFETLNPGKQPISAAELRKRLNSDSKKKSPFLQADNLIAAESNFWPSPTMDKVNGKNDPRLSRISIGDFDSCITAPEPYGYKRESSHR